MDLLQESDDRQQQMEPLSSTWLFQMDTEESSIADATIATATSSSDENMTSRAQVGDIVTIDLRMSPEDGFVPESLFDTHGIISFVLGWGNYLPGLHKLLEGCSVGESVENVSVDSGWGCRRDDLVFEVPLAKLQQIARVTPEIGSTIFLSEGIQVMVTDIKHDDLLATIDANLPLAGTSYTCSFKVLSISPLPTTVVKYIGNHEGQSAISDTSVSNLSGVTSSQRYCFATFALGCFWGAELAFLRVPGVVGTQVGYSQGTTKFPTYEQVCEGTNRHREATLVVYDSTVVSYSELMSVAVERLEETTSSLELHQLFQQDDDENSVQYKYGFYYHTEEQKKHAEEFLQISRNSRFGIELLPATVFYEAEEYHQKYLYKGGQSAKKGSKETIRCFG